MFRNLLKLKMKRINTLLLAISFLLSYNSFAYTSEKDSLLAQFNNSSLHDTIRFFAILDLSLSYVYNNPDSTVFFASKALEFSKTIKDNTLKSKALAQSYNIIGIGYDYGSQFENAKSNYYKSLDLRIQLNDQRGMSACYNNLGAIYDAQGNYPKALEYFLKSLKIKEAVKDKKGMASSLNNIGAIHKDQGDMDKALEYFQKSLDLRIEVDYKIGIGGSYTNLGSIYDAKGDFVKALTHYIKGAELFEELNDLTDLSSSFNNIGALYNDLSTKDDTTILNAYAKGNQNLLFFISNNQINRKMLLDSALNLQQNALEINKELNDEYGMIFSLNGIGAIFLNLKNYQQASFYYQKAITLGEKLNAISELKNSYRGIYTAQKSLNNFSEALQWHEKYMDIKDSLHSERILKKIGHSEAKYEFDKKQAVLKVEHQKNLALANAEKKRQKLVLIAVSLGAFLIILFSIVIYRRLQITKKQKLIIEEQKQMVDEVNEELNQTNEEILAQRDQIEEQKQIVEHKNKAITDSITYAKKIQQALLKNELLTTEKIPPYFIYFQPRDIVSGDFYWTHSDGKYIYLAAVDCTGHGVPGAFMSMLGVSFLNQIVSTLPEATPNQILEELRRKVIQELNQTREIGSSKDGMDIALVRIDLTTNELQYSGAYNPLYLINPNRTKWCENGIMFPDELKGIELKATKQPIGIPLSKDSKKFQNHTITLQKGDCVYIFTDGFADQFGTNESRKYTYRKLKEFLFSIHQEDVFIQKKLLQTEFNSWKENENQIDDVCIIGIKID